MTVIEQLPLAKRVWELQLPYVPMPDDSTLYRWLTLSSLETFERAVFRAAARFRKAPRPVPVQQVYAHTVQFMVEWTKRQKVKQPKIQIQTEEE